MSWIRTANDSRSVRRQSAGHLHHRPRRRRLRRARPARRPPAALAGRHLDRGRHVAGARKPGRLPPSDALPQAAPRRPGQPGSGRARRGEQLRRDRALAVVGSTSCLTAAYLRLRGRRCLDDGSGCCGGLRGISSAKSMSALHMKLPLHLVLGLASFLATVLPAAWPVNAATTPVPDQPAAARALSTAFAGVVRAVRPSVVRLEVEYQPRASEALSAPDPVGTLAEPAPPSTPRSRKATHRHGGDRRRSRFPHHQPPCGPGRHRHRRRPPRRSQAVG